MTFVEDNQQTEIDELYNLVSDNYTNSISSIELLPNTNVLNGTEYNISFQTIGKRLNSIEQETIYYLEKAGLLQYVLIGTQDSSIIDQIQSVIRRVFFNWTNNPNNLIDDNGNYIGSKYGFRILSASSDGWVLQDVETCAKNVGLYNVNELVITNNNYITYAQKTENINTNYVFANTSNVQFNTSQPLPSYQLLALKSYCQNLPPSNSNPKVLHYPIIDSNGNLIPEIGPSQNNGDIIKTQILDNHGSRKEIQISNIGLYGYSRRLSDTTLNFNWYVSKLLSFEEGATYNLRVSLFEFN